MVAVLAFALIEHQRYAAAHDRKGRSQFAEVAAWFGSNDTRWLFSFASICLTLDLDPSCVRAGVRACQEKPSLASPAFFARG